MTFPRPDWTPPDWSVPSDSQPVPRLDDLARMALRLDRAGLSVEVFEDLNDLLLKRPDIFGPLTSDLPAEPMSRSAFAVRCETLHTFARWAHFGFPVFDLTHGLTAALLLTEVGGMDPTEVKPPFPSIRLHIPTGFIRVVRGDRDEWVCAIMAHWHTGDGQPWLRLSAQSTSGLELFQSHPVVHYRDIDRWYRYIPILDSDPASCPEDVSSSNAVSRLVLNLCLWLEAKGQLGRPDNSRRPSRSGGKGRCQPDDLPHPNIWVLGREVKLDKRLHLEAAESCRPAAKRSAEWRIRAAHWVRGHWRHQPCGPKHADRKVVWVQPYCRNRDAALGIGHLYTGGTP